MNRKQLGVTIVLICLMGLLFVGQRIFNERFQSISLMNNNITDFTEYTDKDKEISFKLPSQWENSDRSLPGNYITYYKSFSDSSLGITGYVQLINYKGDDKALIEKDKEYIEGEIGNYSLDSYQSKNYKGYKASFIVTGENKRETFYDVYYLKIKGEKLVKLSFMVDGKYYKTNYQDIFKVLVDSVK